LWIAEGEAAGAAVVLAADIAAAQTSVLDLNVPRTVADQGQLFQHLDEREAACWPKRIGCRPRIVSQSSGSVIACAVIAMLHGMTRPSVEAGRQGCIRVSSSSTRVRRSAGCTRNALRNFIIVRQRDADVAVQREPAGGVVLASFVAVTGADANLAIVYLDAPVDEGGDVGGVRPEIDQPLLVTFRPFTGDCRILFGPEVA
jgi:hypothetical protein